MCMPDDLQNCVVATTLGHCNIQDGRTRLTLMLVPDDVWGKR